MIGGYMTGILGALVAANATLPENTTDIWSPFFPVSAFTLTQWIPILVGTVVIIWVLQRVFSWRNDEDPYETSIERDEDGEDEDPAYTDLSLLDKSEAVIVDIACPRCGAPIHFGEGESLAVCRYCSRQIMRTVKGLNQ